MSYSRVDWKATTPISVSNLNNMDVGIKELSDAVSSLNSAVSNIPNLSKHIQRGTYTVQNSEFQTSGERVRAEGTITFSPVFESDATLMLSINTNNEYVTRNTRLSVVPLAGASGKAGRSFTIIYEGSTAPSGGVTVNWLAVAL